MLLSELEKDCYDSGKPEIFAIPSPQSYKEGDAYLVCPATIFEI
jgi:hypothetical protein